MLKKRIASSMIALSFFALPAVSHASPLMTLPFSGMDVVTKLADWLDLGAPRAAARPARAQRSRMKNGCGIDPNGQPLCTPGGGFGGGAGAGATSSTDDGSNG